MGYLECPSHVSQTSLYGGWDHEEAWISWSHFLGFHRDSSLRYHQSTSANSVLTEDDPVKSLFFYLCWEV